MLPGIFLDFSKNGEGQADLDSLPANVLQENTSCDELWLKATWLVSHMVPKYWLAKALLPWWGPGICTATVKGKNLRK